jgi:23S rRNA pseudouridine2605 synthase
MASVRLQKVLAHAGVSSRRAAEELIAAGRVRVDGRVITELGTKVDPRDARVEVDGTRVVRQSAVYLILHKPRGVVSTMSDPEGRPTVRDLLGDVSAARVYPVGRLDFNTSGALLVTNDGDFSVALMHPRLSVPKTYVLKVQGVMEDPDVDVWRRGVDLEDGKTLPAKVKLLRHEGDKTWLELTITEGRNQQIRRMGDATGFRVMRLARLSFAGIGTEALAPGKWRYLSAEELADLKKQFGIPKRIVSPPNPDAEPKRPAIRPGAPGARPRPDFTRSPRSPYAPSAESGGERPQARRADTRDTRTGERRGPGERTGRGREDAPPSRWKGRDDGAAPRGRSSRDADAPRGRSSRDESAPRGRPPGRGGSDNQRPAGRPSRDTGFARSRPTRDADAPRGRPPGRGGSDNQRPAGRPSRDAGFARSRPTRDTDEPRARPPGRGGSDNQRPPARPNRDEGFTRGRPNRDEGAAPRGRPPAGRPPGRGGSDNQRPPARPNRDEGFARGRPNRDEGAAPRGRPPGGKPPGRGGSDNKRPAGRPNRDEGAAPRGNRGGPGGYASKGRNR